MKCMKNWIQSNFKFEDIQIGMQFLNHESQQLSTVTNKTSSSIEMFNTANKKSFYTAGQKNIDGEVETKVRLKGIDSYNWYTMEQFNRSFQEVDTIQHKLRICEEWLKECIKKQQWTKLVY